MKHGETSSPGDPGGSRTTASPGASAPAATPIAGLYREIWRHAEGARLRLAAALSLLATSQLVKLSLPWLAAQAIDAIQSGGAGGLRSAAGWIVAALGVSACVWLFHGPARVLERGVAVRVRRSVADELYGRLADAPLAWHERHHSGELQHRVDRASQALSGFAQTQFVYLQNVIHLAGPVVALWLLSTVTGVAAVAGFVAVGLVTVRFDRVLMRLAAEETTAERGYAARLLDFVGNIGAVASLRLQGATRRLLDEKLGGVFGPLGRSIVINEWKWCVVDLSTIALGWALVAAYAGSTVAAGGALMIGSLYMVHQYATQAGGVLCSIAAHYQGLVRTQTDYASAEPVRRAPAGTPAVRQDDAAWQTLSLHQVGYRHERHDRGGVHGVTLALARGERLALVGASGSGKSTLLRVLAGLYPAQHGHVSLDGVPRLGRRDAADLATLIPQEAEVFETTLRENLTFGEPVDEASLRHALHASAFDEVLATLPHGLDTWMSERGANLSGGQRQRLALARGLLAARGSSLLLLDEPTSALDPVIEQRVQQRVAAAFPDATMVASVHRLSLLPHFDRVVFMAGGRVVDVGSADEVARRQPAFAAMRAGATGAGDAAPAAA